MSKTSKTVLIVVILAVLAIIIALAVKGGDSNEVNQNEVEEMEEVDENVVEVDENTILYTANGFEPDSLTVEAGETVTWVNDSSGGMWVASDVHPTHEVLPEFDQLSPGDTYSFTFEEAGEWNFHNHLSSHHIGTVIVQ